MRNTLIAQFFLVIVVAVIFASVAGAESALGAAFGGGIALVNGLLLFWRYHRGNQSHADPGGHLRSFFASAIERFVMVAVLFAIGFGVLRLAPLPLLIGFIVVQAGLLVAGLRQKSGNP